MAALVRQTLRVSVAKKTVYGIRHGQAWHNVLFDDIGPCAYTSYQDTTLTAEGMEQAAVQKPPDVDLVLVSPLMRTLQTADIMFPKTPQIALECLKEYPQHTELCNKRSYASLLIRCFPHVNFEDLETEFQMWPMKVDHNENVERVKSVIESVSSRQIAIVTHSTWLKYWMNGSLSGLPELEHCRPYELKYTV